METMIELERARSLIEERIGFLEMEKIPLAFSYGRVLAENLYSPLPIPPFFRSPLDGYSYRGEVGNTAPLSLQIVSEIPAGTWSDGTIKEGEAAKIFTGAPIPPGANCVVRVEDTEEKDGMVLVKKPVLPGENIVARGEEIEVGELLLERGSLLNPPAVGFLASVGIKEVLVFRRPKVGILSTGSELAELGDRLLPGKIYNSNSYTLAGLVQGLGCEVHILPVVQDNLPDTMAALQRFEEMNVVITTGGASVGDYDLMPEVLSMLGCEILFWKVNLKPGTPVVMGYREKQMYFALSGNPAAAMTTFELLVRPALQKYAGRSEWKLQEIPVRIEGNFAKWGRQRRFLRAKVIWKDGELWADINQSQTSGVLRTLIGSQLLVDVPADHGPVRQGEILKAIWLSSWGG